MATLDSPSTDVEQASGVCVAPDARRALARGVTDDAGAAPDADDLVG